MNASLLQKITLNSDICHGKPCVRGLRYPVEFLLELLSSGVSHAEILFKHKPILPLKIMTSAEKLYQLIQTLPESQINEVLNFAEFLHQRQVTPTQPQAAIPLGTLTGLRGIAKRLDLASGDQELQSEYTDYLTQKYQ
jgi:uncharacterized protein (DUF433 family)